MVPKGAHTPKRGRRFRGEVDHRARRPQEFDGLGYGNPPTARSEHHSAAGMTHLARQGVFQLPEIRLAPQGENLGDRRALSPFDLLVEIEKRPAQASGKLATDRGLSRPGKPNEDDVGVPAELGLISRPAHTFTGLGQARGAGAGAKRLPIRATYA